MHIKLKESFGNPKENTLINEELDCLRLSHTGDEFPSLIPSLANKALGLINSFIKYIKDW